MVLTGLRQNLDHIVLGTDETGISGLVIGSVGIGVIILLCFVTNWVAWHRPRQLQVMAKPFVEGFMLGTINSLDPRAEFPRDEISPRHWANGKLPTSDEWLDLKADGFRDYRLPVGGLVERPSSCRSTTSGRWQARADHPAPLHPGVERDRRVGWGAAPDLIEHVQPTAVRHVVFRSFGEGLEAGQYYESHTMANALHPQSLLAYEMNFEPLGDEHGAPLRLRVENQLGYKMVKWIRSIEFVADLAAVGQGYGGINEDEEYFDLVANL